MYSKLRDQAHKTLQVILILIGISSSAGYAFNLRWLENLGLFTVTSPLPVVFSTVGGINMFTAEYSVVLRAPKKKDRTLSIQYKPDAPVLYLINHMSPFFFLGNMSESYFTPIVRYFYCPKRKPLEAKKDISIGINVAHETTEGNITSVREVSCQ